MVLRLTWLENEQMSSGAEKMCCGAAVKRKLGFLIRQTRAAKQVAKHGPPHLIFHPGYCSIVGGYTMTKAAERMIKTYWKCIAACGATIGHGSAAATHITAGRHECASALDEKKEL